MKKIHDVEFEEIEISEQMEFELSNNKGDDDDE